MNRSHYPQRHGRWPHVLMLLAVLAVLASVRSAQAEARIWLVKDINIGTQPSLSSYTSGLTAVGSTLFFRADDGNTGQELWALSLSSLRLRRSYLPIIASAWPQR